MRDGAGAGRGERVPKRNGELMRDGAGAGRGGAGAEEEWGGGVRVPKRNGELMRDGAGAGRGGAGAEEEWGVDARRSGRGRWAGCRRGMGSRCETERGQKRGGGREGEREGERERDQLGPLKASVVDTTHCCYGLCEKRWALGEAMGSKTSEDVSCELAQCSCRPDSELSCHNQVLGMHLGCADGEQWLRVAVA
eukprot:351377-Chlamydomonas_euryale.AAC.2